MQEFGGRASSVSVEIPGATSEDPAFLPYINSTDNQGHGTHTAALATGKIDKRRERTSKKGMK